MTSQVRMLLILAIVVLAAFSTYAQSGLEFAEPVPSPSGAGDPLWNACDGAWQRVREANHRGLSMSEHAPTRTEEPSLLCLMKAIDKTTFDKKSRQFDNVMASVATGILVDAWGEKSYDFFAAQLDRQPMRVSRGIADVLMGHGHPDAFRRYFGIRRERLARNEEWNRQNPDTPGVFQSLLETGRCAMPLCSSRIDETLRIITENLDVIDLELAGTESIAGDATAPASVRDTVRLRANARSLRELVKQIEHGTSRIGAKTN